MPISQASQDTNKYIEAFGEKVFGIIWKQVLVELVRSGSGLKKRPEPAEQTVAIDADDAADRASPKTRELEAVHIAYLPSVAARWAANATLDIEREALTLIAHFLTGSGLIREISKLAKDRRSIRQRELMQLSHARGNSAKERAKSLGQRAQVWLEKFEGIQKDHPRWSDDEILNIISKQPPFKSKGVRYSPRYIGKVVYKTRHDREKRARRTVM